MATETVSRAIAHGASAPLLSPQPTQPASSSRSSCVGIPRVKSKCLSFSTAFCAHSSSSESAGSSLSLASTFGRRKLCLRGESRVGKTRLWDGKHACRRCSSCVRRRPLSSSCTLSGEEPGVSRAGRRGRHRRGRVGTRAAGLDGEAPVGDSEPAASSGGKKSDQRVLVVGATGGVGQLTVAGLLRHGYQVRALVRNKEKGEKLYGQDHDGERLQLCHADIRFPGALSPSIFEGISFVVLASGTTAYPSNRWDGDNGPEKTDHHGVRNLTEALPPTVKKVVMVSSVGIERKDSFPWSLINVFGVLSYKKLGEECVRQCGIPYTIIRAARLTDGPYTSYDINTLLKATAGDRKAVVVEKGDTLSGEVSRISVAEACIQALQIDCTSGQTYCMNNVKGEGPGSDTERWERIFAAAPSK